MGAKVEGGAANKAEPKMGSGRPVVETTICWNSVRLSCAPAAASARRSLGSASRSVRVCVRASTGLVERVDVGLVVVLEGTGEVPVGAGAGAVAEAGAAPPGAAPGAWARTRGTEVSSRAESATKIDNGCEAKLLEYKLVGTCFTPEGPNPCDAREVRQNKNGAHRRGDSLQE